MDVDAFATTAEVEVEPGVYLVQLVAGDQMSIQHLRMDPGAVIPSHNHHHEQVGFVYAGECTFFLEDDQVTVEAGGSYRLESNQVHGVENEGTDELLAIDVFSPPRPNPDWAT